MLLPVKYIYIYIYIFLNISNLKWSPKNQCFYLFEVFRNLFLKVGAKHILM